MLSWIALPWKAGALIACAIGIAAACARLLDTDQAEPSVRWERKLRLLADRIAAYGHSVRRRHPTGDVVVKGTRFGRTLSQGSETIASALNIPAG
jgi:thioesterase domain-containing protein